MAAARAFRETMMSPALGGPSGAAASAEFSSWGERSARYWLGWAYYRNEAYRTTRGVSGEIVQSRGLYKHVRCVKSPGYRAVESYAQKIWLGGLDREAGDGEDQRSAIPIVIEEDRPEPDRGPVEPPALPEPGAPLALPDPPPRERPKPPHPLRRAIARLWADSFWESNKTLLCRFAAAMGDAAIMLDVHDQDGATPGKVCLVPASADEFPWVKFGRNREVLAYVREYRRVDDEDERLPGGKRSGLRRYVTYREEAELVARHDDGTPRAAPVVEYTTYKNERPHAWDGRASASWTADYPAVPLVFVQHELSGQDWGLSCFHAGISRFAEIDDQASGLGDQVRKTIRGQWLLAGVKKPSDEEINPRSADDESQADRQQVQAKYGPVDAKAYAMVLPLDIPGVAEWVRALDEDIEKNYPELRDDISTSAGDASGRALRVARQVAEARVQAVRPNYDEALIRAHKLAIAIAGERRFPGYEGFSHASLLDGSLDHGVGHRPVFAADPMDEMEAEGLALANFNAAIQGGLSFELAAEWYLGLSGEDLARAVAAKAKAQAEAMALADRAARQEAGRQREEPPGAPRGTVAVPAPPGVKDGERA